MKKLAIVLCLILACAAPGCKKPTAPTTPPTSTDPSIATNAEIIHLATSEALSIGLNVYARSHPAEAAAIATKIKEIASTNALAYLNGTSGASSAAVNGFLNSQFVTLPPEATQLIALAAALLDAYLPAPTADTILSAAQYSYLKAFVQGLSDGSAQFLAGNIPVRTVTTKAVRGHWLQGS